MFDAGAIVSKITLDRKPFDESRRRVAQGVQEMRGRFQGMAESFKKNWLAATAAITAAIMALRQAFRYMEMGARAEQIESSFESMARSVGISADRMRRSIMEATRETVNFSNVAAGVSTLMATGLGLDEIASLFERARGLARIFGQDTEQAVQVIVGAISGQLVTTLRRAYGLNISLAEAVERYAEAIGKTTDEVKANYMAQAVANEILKATEGHMKAVNLEVMTQYEQIQKLKAGWTGFTESLGIFFLKLFNAIKSILMVAASGITRIYELITAAVVGLLQSIEMLITQLERIPGIGKNFQSLAESIKYTRHEIDLFAGAWAKMGTDLAAEAQQIWSDVFATVKEQGDEVGEFLLERIRVVADGMKDAADDVEKEFKAMEEFGKQAARNIQDAFANFFFKAFTGELRNLKELFADFGRAILQTISNVIAQMMVVSMFKSMGFGSLLGFQSGIESVPSTGMYKLHAGEKVVPRYDATKPESQPVTIYNAITSEAVAQAMAGREGEGVIVNIINSNSLRNGVVRREVVRR